MIFVDFLLWFGDFGRLGWFQICWGWFLVIWRGVYCIRCDCGWLVCLLDLRLAVVWLEIGLVCVVDLVRGFGLNGEFTWGWLGA